MRLLYVFPIIHTDIELGSLAPNIQKEFIARNGPIQWKKHKATVEQFWDRLERKLESLDLDYSTAHIYQDGFPTGIDGQKMVKDLVARGSRNYTVVQSCIRRGATLEGTEDPVLIREEYDRLKNPGGKDRVIPNDLLKERDRFIADRIDETLPADEMGIVFIGAKHDVGRFLPGDIRVTTIRFF